MTTDYADVLHSPDVDAVAVVTPVWTHYELAKSALASGKHVFVEKPFTSTPHQAEELIELADRKNLKIMVDHTFLFSGAVRKIREVVDSGALGPLYYFDSTRVNLGLFQHDVSVIWDLAPHDLSIMDHITRGAARSCGGDRRQPSERPCGHGVHHHLLSAQHHRPHQRQLAVAGQSPHHPDRRQGQDAGLERSRSRREDQDLRQGREHHQRADVYDLLVSYRSGDVWAPKCDQTEALAVELKYFIDCILNDRTPLNDGAAGLRVVRLLDAAQRSLKDRGRIVSL